MSDTQQGHGWWLASDGKWYPPQAPPPQSTEVAYRTVRAISGVLLAAGLIFGFMPGLAAIGFVLVIIGLMGVLMAAVTLKPK